MGMVSEPILGVSYRIGYRPILPALLQVQHLLTGRIKQQIKGHSRPVTRRACMLFDGP